MPQRRFFDGGCGTVRFDGPLNLKIIEPQRSNKKILGCSPAVKIACFQDGGGRGGSVYPDTGNVLATFDTFKLRF